MKACILHAQQPVAQSPLRVEEVAVPEPAAGEVLIRVYACAVCRTDLHVVEGELHARKMPLIPGHQVVGVVERGGTRFAPGQRVGVAWLHRTCGDCHYCRSGRENLCSHPDFTGYSVNGGFAEYMVAQEDFVYALPEGYGGYVRAVVEDRRGLEPQNRDFQVWLPLGRIDSRKRSLVGPCYNP